MQRCRTPAAGRHLSHFLPPFERCFRQFSQRSPSRGAIVAILAVEKKVNLELWRVGPKTTQTHHAVSERCEQEEGFDRPLARCQVSDGPKRWLTGKSEQRLLCWPGIYVHLHVQLSEIEFQSITITFLTGFERTTRHCCPIIPYA